MMTALIVSFNSVDPLMAPASKARTKHIPDQTPPKYSTLNRRSVRATEYPRLEVSALDLAASIAVRQEERVRARARLEKRQQDQPTIYGSTPDLPACLLASNCPYSNIFYCQDLYPPRIRVEEAVGCDKLNDSFCDRIRQVGAYQVIEVATLGTQE
ncbi:hypothetical protein BJV78DRAFT_1151624 [Lactifluus subvellereus]|nr:hypothetical protein BJV78DRAFT_1151624 [Lactifluus subvellereus]